MSGDKIRMSLSSCEYMGLLGKAVYMFNSNNSFMIENMTRCSGDNKSWYELIDKTSGQLKKEAKEIFSGREDIYDLFSDLIDRRNRILHSFPITTNNDEEKCRDGNDQILSTKDKNHIQYVITEAYLIKFIKDNDRLSSMLEDFRKNNVH